MGLQYIDIFSTVRFVFSELSINAKNDPLLKLRTELTHILEAKIQEQQQTQKGGTKKGKNDSDISASSTDFTGQSLTEDMCSYIPDQLLRECVFLRLKYDPICIRKGYVIDLWKKLFNNASELLQLIGGLVQDEQMENKVTNQIILNQTEPCDLSPAKQNLLADGTQLIIELEVFFRYYLLSYFALLNKFISF